MKVWIQDMAWKLKSLVSEKTISPTVILKYFSIWNGQQCLNSYYKLNIKLQVQDSYIMTCFSCVWHTIPSMSKQPHALNHMWTSAHLMFVLLHKLTQKSNLIAGSQRRVQPLTSLHQDKFVHCINQCFSCLLPSSEPQGVIMSLFLTRLISLGINLLIALSEHYSLLLI